MPEPVTISLSFLSHDLGLATEQVEAVVSLLDEGHPIPFIARYRKDMTGNMDEVHLRLIASRLREQRLLTERKQTILRLIESLGKLTPDLEKKIRESRTGRRLEDLYLPYKQKKQTLASTAREHGLQELADEILAGAESCRDLEKRAADFISETNGVQSAAEAILGAGHIISEFFSEKIELRQRVREIFQRSGRIVSKKVEPKIELVPPVVLEKAEEKTEEKTADLQMTGEASEKAPEAPSTESPQASVSEAVETPPADQSPEAETPSVTPDDSSDQPPRLSELKYEIKKPDSETPEAAVPPEPVAPSDSSLELKTEPVAANTKPVAEAKSDDFRGPKSSGKKSKKKSKDKGKKSAAEQKLELEAKLYSDYYDFTSPIRNCPSYRILAINRGERTKVLRVRLEVEEDSVRDVALKAVISEDHPNREFLSGCVLDALDRLVLPSLEREIRRDLTDEAEKQAVRVFAKNLRNLLLQKPLFRRRVLAVDPGFRYGCKLVALDEFGNFLAAETVYITGGAERRAKAQARMAALIEKFNLSVIAIGNGTGCREAEDFTAKMIAERFADLDIAYIIVNEAGASVYSVSPAAKEEFPHYDPLVRGAVSIGRRLQDPLNELVKIEPASLGVGIYQHDLKAKHLRDSLSEVVESSVNYVGVDLNSATGAILKYVAGLNQLTAKRIFEYRMEHGPFHYREELKNVPGLGPSAYTHAAGFLKINDGYEPLDATWIHPESYPLAEKILEKLGMTKEDLRNSEKRAGLGDKIAALSVKGLADEFGAGMMTIADILDQFKRPGRDPRETLPAPIFKKGVMKIEDLTVGMELMGTVLNVVDFGAFVDIGLHDSGLIHISRMGDRFVRDAHQQVAVGDVVKVWVVEVDSKRRRISLSMVAPGTERKFEGHSRGERGENDEVRQPSRPRPRSEGERNTTSEENGQVSSRDRGLTDSPNRLEGERRDRRRDDRSDRPRRPDGGQREGSVRDGSNRDGSNRDGSRREGRGNPANGPRSGGNGGSYGREGRPSSATSGDRRERRDDRRNDGRRDRFDRSSHEPRSVTVISKDKRITPISDGMKQGKEPLRSFSDLAQLFGRVQPTPDKSKEKKQAKAENAKPENSTSESAPDVVPEPTKPEENGANEN